MTTRYPFVKIDQTKDNTFTTTSITFLNNPTLTVRTQVYQFAHGYDYLPQAWGLWNITSQPAFGQYDQAYGTYNASSGAGPNLVLEYDIDDENVTLYATFTDPFASGATIIGTVAEITLYVFVDDLTAHDYTTD